MNIFEGIDKNLVQAFWKYHEENPDVFDQFKFFSEEMLDRGFKKISGRQIIERIRWFYQIEKSTEFMSAPKEPKIFKINNDFAAMYARLLEATHSRFAGCFEKRGMKSKNRCWSEKQRKMEGINL